MKSQNPFLIKLSTAKQKLIKLLLQVLGKTKKQPEWYYLRKGNQLLDEGHLTEANAFFKKLMQQQPDLYIPYLGLAKLAKTKQNWESCIDFYTICFKRFPNNEKEFWYLHLAEALNKQEKISEAQSIYEACSKKYPNKVSSFVELALLAQRNRQWEQALDYWQICFQQFPKKIRPLWHQKKQRVLIELGQNHDAQQEALARIKMLGGEKYANIIQQKSLKKTPHNLNFQHILIITYGRSGSTLLQGILNTLDGVIIRGENDNIFFNLFKTYKKLIHLKDNHKTAVLPNHPWYGISFIDEKLLLAHFSELAKGILLAEMYDNTTDICYGFKEIRYDKVGEDFDLYLDFLNEIFPNSAFIFNTRNLKDVSNSAWWKDKKTEEVIEDLSNLEAKFEAYSQMHDFCFRIDYRDIVSKGEKLKDLFDFLGASYSQETIETVLSTPHSYNPEQQHIKQLFNKF